MKILYTSSAIKKCIRELFDEPKRSHRRVILVAYIGGDHAKFLPHPRGVQVICSPTAGATSSIAVSELLEAGADVSFSDKLHMKVYWSARRGSLITSANLSKNALGIRGLKEAGVLLEASAVDIDELLKQAKPYRVTDTRLAKLKREEEEFKQAMAKFGKRLPLETFDFLDWHKLKAPVRTEWKLGWWDSKSDFAEAGKSWVRTQHGRSTPFDILNVSRGEVAVGDWLLLFRLGRGGEVGTPDWMHVDHVVSIRRNEPAFDEHYPYQAMQALPKGKYPDPPFRITPIFRKALQTALKKYGVTNIENSQSLVPSRRLLKLIIDNARSAP